MGSELIPSQLPLLQQAVRSLASGVSIAPAGAGDHPLIYVNPAFCRITGYPADEVIGRDARFLQAGIDQPGGLEEVRKALAEQREATVLLRNRRKDGSIFLNEMTVTPVRDERGKVTHFIGLQQDVTARALADAQVRRLNEELAAFAYSVSHDLRAPVDAIAGFCTAARERLHNGPASKVAHFLARIDANATRMKERINALLRLSQISEKPLVPQHCSLTLVAQEVLSELAAADPTRQVHVTVQEDLWCAADRDLLRALLGNLLSNAWKYTRHTPNAAISVGYTSETAEFFVRDNGAGFDLPNAHTLFCAFQRFHGNEFEGTGIGLAIARRVVLAHGGAIRAQASPGHGACFYFRLSPAEV